MPRADYAPTTQPTAEKGARISRVDPASPAARAGLVPGDVVLAADGAPLRDILDWRWIADGPRAELLVRSADKSEAHALTLERDLGETWGLEFAEAVFDRVRTCRNNCAFCFMTQLPPGLRPALYLRDDDFRLSFLQGNFITLTNLDDADVVRIAEQQLSPLYVSLHSVDSEIRRQLVCARTDRALERFDELLAEGIDLHVQIVLVPGVNDGPELERTLYWLAEREGVASVGIVPLGYTRYQECFSASYGEPEAARAVIEQVRPWQFAMRERDGVTWVHMADEFYLNARERFPTAEHYDGFAQYENGIGIVRTFVDEVTEMREEFVAAVSALPEEAEAVTVVTGMMAATTLAGALGACSAAGRMRLLAVPNRFFGGNVSVTGLLTGDDIARAIAADLERPRPTGADKGNIYLVPDIVMNADGLMLDDLTFTEMCERSGADVRLVSSDAAGLLEGIGRAAEALG